MAPTPRTAFCLFCDDIRQEIGGKLSYIGTYQSVLIVTLPPNSQEPAFLPKFAIAVWLLSDRNDKPGHVIVRVTTPPGQTEIARMEADQNQITALPPIFQDATRSLLSMNLAFANVVLAGGGEIEVTIETERETLRAGRLKVVFASSISDAEAVAMAFTHPSPPTASSPLPEQSPPAAPASKLPASRRRPSSRRSARTPEPE